MSVEEEKNQNQEQEQEQEQEVNKDSKLSSKDDSINKKMKSRQIKDHKVNIKEIDYKE